VTAACNKTQTAVFHIDPMRTLSANSCIQEQDALPFFFSKKHNQT
jgi:hypothetical protein